MSAQALHEGRHNHHDKSTQLAHHILHRLFKKYLGAFTVKLWDNSVLHIGKGISAFTLSIRSPAVIRQLVLHQDPIRLAEAYFDGEVEISGDFNTAMGLRYYLENLKLPFQEKLLLAWRVLALKNAAMQLQRNQNKASAKKIKLSRENSVETIAFHYDVSNEFYKTWLDERMVYSCAYFESPTQDINQAQCNKLDYICRKLRLQPGESLLDIGCGWGALVCWAAKHYGVRAHGITLSCNQFEYALDEVNRQGLEGLVTIELRNYRDLARVETYDKVASIGMFEHVGLKNLPTYFSIVHQVLKPGGLFLNHGITSDEPGWSRDVATKFINRHIFPDGELDTVSNIQQRMEEAKFELLDVEGLRPHYALTLRNWVNRLDAKREEVIRLVGERTYRVWRLYMTGSALQFEQGATGIYQILAQRKQDGLPSLPLTRRDLYESKSKHSQGE
jgi:cyclopropane-fatty-acyl-phospholipid synthase